MKATVYSRLDGKKFIEVDKPLAKYNFDGFAAKIIHVTDLKLTSISDIEEAILMLEVAKRCFKNPEG